MAIQVTPEQSTFLQDHYQAVLATSKKNGSPQVSTIYYEFDGETIVISAKEYTAKWKNIIRNPNCALVINDGHAQLLVYGLAEGITEDPERLQEHRRISRVLDQPEVSDQELSDRLTEQKRTIIRVRPVKIFANK